VMHGFWILVHALGYTLWIGGGIATMVLGIAAKRFPPPRRVAAYQLTSAVWRVLVAPGAVAVVVSGLLVSMPYMKSGAVPGWMMLMMTTGIVGCLIALGVSLPAAASLGRIELTPQGELPPHFAGLRARLVWGSSIAGALALIALAGGTLLRG
jgi:hypothetical protein